MAAAEGNIEALSYLTKVVGGSVNIVDGQGRSPLDDALETHHFAAAAMLEDVGALRAVRILSHTIESERNDQHEIA